MSNEILAGKICLPLLVKGRVAIIVDGEYELLRPTSNTDIEDNFNPIRYSILIHDKYPRCIVYSTEKEEESYLVNDQMKDIERVREFNKIIQKQ